MLRMDLNTNLLGPNPVVMEAIKGFDEDVSHYPTMYADNLREALAEYYGLEPENFLCGCGADGMINLITSVHGGPGKTVAWPEPSFTLYRFYAAAYRSDTLTVPLDEKFRLDADMFLETAPTLIFISNPNNPTGNLFDEEGLRRLMDSDSLVVLDEAYAEFSGVSHIEDAAEGRIIAIRSFSKAFAMAGLRVGYCIGSPEAIGELRQHYAPFTLNTLSEHCAVAALRDPAWMRWAVKELVRQREELARKLEGMGFTVFPSSTNFLLVTPPCAAAALRDSLMEKGIAVRHYPEPEVLADKLRITVGSEEHNAVLVEAIQSLL